MHRRQTQGAVPTSDLEDLSCIFCFKGWGWEPGVFPRQHQSSGNQKQRVGTNINQHVWSGTAPMSVRLALLLVVLAFPASVQQRKENTATLCSTVQLHIPCLPEIYRKPLSWGHLAITDKILAPNGVRH